MNIRRVGIPAWILFLCVCGLVWNWAGCEPAAPCTAPQVEKDGQCVTPGKEPVSSDEQLGEPSTEPEPREKPGKEPGKEPTKEPKKEPSKEVAKEKVTSPEPVTPDEVPVSKEEPVVEDAGVPEPVREPSGPEPTVQIVTPKDAAVVFGDVMIKIQATVGTGAKIERVELKADGKIIHQWSAAPYEYKYATKALTDGKHTLTAIAYTDLGKTKNHKITVTTANKGPQITILSPKASEGISGSFTIEAKVVAAQGLKAGSVKLEVDGAPVVWTQTTPTFKATFDPKGKPYGSFPIAVSAEDSLGKKDDEEIWVIFEIPAGPKKVGEECDDSDAQKRCLKGHSCLTLGSGATPKSLCYKHCVVGGPKTQCPVTGGTQYICQVAFQGTTRGVCAEGPPTAGQLFSACGNLKNQKCTSDANCKSPERCVQTSATNPQKFCTVQCNTGLLCVGAQKRPDGRLISFCVKTCLTPPPGTPTYCPGASGFLCVGLSNGGGACIEQCGQKCTADANCSKGQKCTGGSCSTPFCPNYGSCVSLTGLASRVCI